LDKEIFGSQERTTFEKCFTCKNRDWKEIGYRRWRGTLQLCHENISPYMHKSEEIRLK